MPTDEIHNVPEEETKTAREVRRYHRRQSFEALHHQERQFVEAAASHRKETEILLADNFPKKNACFYRLEIKVAAEVDDGQRIYLHGFLVESTQAREAQCGVLNHEEFHRRDSLSQGMMRSLEFESHSDQGFVNVAGASHGG